MRRAIGNESDLPDATLAPSHPKTADPVGRRFSRCALRAFWCPL